MFAVTLWTKPITNDRGTAGDTFGMTKMIVGGKHPNYVKDSIKMNFTFSVLRKEQCLVSGALAVSRHISFYPKHVSDSLNRDQDVRKVI